MMQKKNQKIIAPSKGSVAVFALILMFILTIATIGIITTAAIERKTSIATGNSTTAFQVAESGMEKTLQYFKSNFDKKLSDIPSSPACANGVGIVTYSTKNTVKFKDKNAAYITDCATPISSVKIIKSIGTTKQETRAIEEDIFLAATKLLLHFNATNADDDFEDSSFYYSNHKIDTNGDAKSSTERKLGDASAYFDGAGDYLSVSDSDDWNFGTGDFTIDFWEKSSSVIRQHAFSFGKVSDKNLDFDFNDSGYGIWVYWNGGGTPYIREGASGSYTNGSWHHIALVRKTGVITLYVDGQSKGNTSYAGNIDLSGSGVPHYIGASGSGSLYWNGYIDELRISKGIARWTSNFDKPIAEYWPD
jgi:Tfp pilus assembly protein PilX